MAAGLTRSVQDADGNLTTTATYDGFDRAIQVNFPSITAGSGTSDPANYEAYGYDNNGNQTSRRPRGGDTLTFTYDALNRVRPPRMDRRRRLPSRGLRHRGDEPPSCHPRAAMGIITPRRVAPLSNY